MSIVAVDVGNSSIKAGLFKDQLLYERQVFKNAEGLKKWLDETSGIQHIVLGAVGSLEPGFNTIEENYKVHFAQTDWNHPLKIEYESIGTLGVDRLAAVVGAWHKFENASLIFDIGSCMTIDYVDETGTYQGGNIAPGWQMRLKAMHKYTARLPLVSAQESDQLFAKSTKQAIQLGAFNGLKFEMERYIENVKQRNAGINVILTGGNAFQFAKYLKMEIFVLPDIILEGLFKLLHANI